MDEYFYGNDHTTQWKDVLFSQCKLIKSRVISTVLTYSNLKEGSFLQKLQPVSEWRLFLLTHQHSLKKKGLVLHCQSLKEHVFLYTFVM